MLHTGQTLQVSFNCCFTVHFDKSKAFFQQIHSLLKHKMLQLTLKISLYMAPTCFGLFGPSSGSIRRNIAKVTVFVGLLVKIHRQKCCCTVAICAVCTGCCAPHSTQYTQHILPQYSNIFNDVFLLIILQRL
jgi:hypothetical protein